LDLTIFLSTPFLFEFILQTIFKDFNTLSAFIESRCLQFLDRNSSAPLCFLLFCLKLLLTLTSLARFHVAFKLSLNLDVVDLHVLVPVIFLSLQPHVLPSLPPEEAPSLLNGLETTMLVDLFDSLGLLLLSLTTHRFSIRTFNRSTATKSEDVDLLILLILMVETMDLLMALLWLALQLSPFPRR